MLPKDAPKMQAKTTIVACLGGMEKKKMSMTTLVPPPPNPAIELSPLTIIMMMYPMS